MYIFNSHIGCINPYRNNASKAATHRASIMSIADNDMERRPEDSEIEVANMNPGIGKMEPFPSIWGHWAGGE